VTITGGGGAAPYEVLAGTGGTTFFDSSALGGGIGLGGGANTVAGNSSLAPLQGNWLIDAGTGNPNSTYYLVLGKGADTVSLGGKTTVFGGTAGTLILNGNTDSVDPVVVTGAGSETVSGLLGGDMLIGPGPTVKGADLLEGGVLGGDTISAPVASGINTIVGGGPGDALFAASGPVGAIFFAGTGAETVQAGPSTASLTIYGGTSFANGKPNDVIAGGSGDSYMVAGAGAGNDTIFTYKGHDSVWFVQSVTGGHKSTDILADFNTSRDKFLYQRYGKDAFTVSTISGGTYAGKVEFTMSDGTKVIFADVTDSHLIKTFKSDAPGTT